MYQTVVEVIPLLLLQQYGPYVSHLMITFVNYSKNDCQLPYKCKLVESSLKLRSHSVKELVYKFGSLLCDFVIAYACYIIELLVTRAS